MDTIRGQDHNIRNLLHTAVLILGMALLLALCGELLLGAGTWIWAFAAVALFLMVVPRVPPVWVLRMYQARRLDAYDAPRLTALLQELAQRAGLPAAPSLYWVPSRSLNAFAVGRREDAAIAVTDGLLRRLELRELAGVLAHEISHLASNDMRLLGLADVISRTTHFLAMAGLIMVVLSLPMLLLGYVEVSFTGLLLLLAAPSLSGLLQLALSRVREFDADLHAARFTGDPEGLASALAKIEEQQVNFWQRILFPGYRDTGPSLLRTHPHTHERIARLLDLRDTHRIAGPVAGLSDDPFGLPEGFRVTRRSPRFLVIRGIRY